MQSKLVVATTNIHTVITKLPAIKKRQPGLALVTGIRAGYMTTQVSNGLGAGGLAVGNPVSRDEGVGAYEGEA